jgi:hypothetical protein
VNYAFHLLRSLVRGLAADEGLDMQTDSAEDRRSGGGLLIGRMPRAAA